ncbi:acetylornithine deacetylase [Defluviimonas denitrificans]|jgi:acetylornithine deacetylase|uniref:Acetylornithine deacetylase n=1 Tax=Albidovulum denitrificans TaxID=404881 RepID=A0A2S8RYR1_9RHOB|nr:acetylornithine deacetylase [Defluviimonas denitrificans]PQV53661.1 acetylornithine deacetylase [Defluviimonas denitrificans]
MTGALSTPDLLERLIGFPTISSASNLPLIGFVAEYLDGLGAAVTRIDSPDGTKAALLARIGPAGDGGALLSAHSDVVPVAGQAWQGDPFRLRRAVGRLYGRGTADMKGFLASALAVAGMAAQRDLTRPLLLALSYDEEVGCLGIRGIIDHVIPALGRPEFCIVGEPTGMRVAVGHKGKAVYRATCHGVAGHSALAPRFVNALHLAADFVGVLRAEQAYLADEGAQDPAYDVPCSTVHAGLMSGGAALNIVPDRATVDFEIRHLAEEPVEGIIDRIGRAAEGVALAMRHPGAGIGIDETNRYPGLSTPPGAEVVATVSALAGTSGITKVAFGTEAGFFAEKGIPTVVCGPGSMDQGHRADEFIAEDQLAACDRMLAALVDRLE